MDQRLIDHMTKGSGQKLVRGIVKQIEGRAAYRRQQAAKSPEGGSDAQAGYEGVNAANKTAPKDKEPGDLDREGSPPTGGRVSRQVLELEAILNELITEHRRLLKHVDVQQAAMKSMDLPRMADCAKMQEASRLRLASLETKRPSARPAVWPRRTVCSGI